MVQVDTQSPFRHDSQHSSYYYPSASSPHAGSPSSHHSSPRIASIIPQRYYSPSKRYTSDECLYHTAYRSTYSHVPRSEETEDCTYPSLPAYDNAMSGQVLAPEPVRDQEKEENYDEPQEENPPDSPSLSKPLSPSSLLQHISDDIRTVRGPAPSRHVDYLSHDWEEPDIWSSWRYVRKEKSGYLQNAARLENASWRTWAKSKYKLKTITPETLNWLKDCDVTWLYGPLQTQAGTMAQAYGEPSSRSRSAPSTPHQKMSRCPSFNVPAKPILKKRSHSEIMLTSLKEKTQENLLTRAAQAVQEERRRELEEQELREEQRKHPLTPAHVLRNQIRRRSSTDLASHPRDSPDSPFPVNKNAVTSIPSDYFGQGCLSSSSGLQTPSASKHIHFNDRVEQCIAVEAKDDEEDNMAVDEDSEDEGLFMGMKSRNYVPKTEHSIIAKLPATTLRPGDEPIREPPQASFNLAYDPGFHEDFTAPAVFDYGEGTGFSSSESPPKFPPDRYPFEQEDPMDDIMFDHPFALQSIPEHVVSSSSSSSSASSRRSSDLNLDEESQRRSSVSAIPIPTARSMSARDHVGMMGEEVDEEGIGIVGLAADAFSTAKDIMGVIWNAGWGGRR